MVIIHAHTICPATPHFTALRRLSAPTPTMEPVMVCVVLTGMPKAEEINSVMAAPNSAQNPSTGLSLAGSENGLFLIASRSTRLLSIRCFTK